MQSMVCTGEREMAVRPERSKSFLNFQLPGLWGSKRYLRCVKTDNASTVTESSSAAADRQHGHGSVFQRRRSPLSKPESIMVGGKRRRELESSPSNNNGRERRLRISNLVAAEEIEQVRVKLTKDLETAVENIIFWPEAADKNKNSIFRDVPSDYDDVDNDEDEFEGSKQKVKDTDKEKEKESEESPAVEVEAEAEARPWNLRTRRAACKAPNDGGRTNSNYNSPMKNEVTNLPRVGDRGPSVASWSTSAAEKQRPRAKFSVPLSKMEIEKDLMMMMAGHRPPRRPKKRSRYVQNHLDLLFPGSFLREVTAEDYKVQEFVESGRR